MFHYVARYVYKDLHKKSENFHKMLFDNLLLFVRLEMMMDGCTNSEEYSLGEQQTEWSIDLLLTDDGESLSSVPEDYTNQSICDLYCALEGFRKRTKFRKVIWADKLEH